MVDDLAALPDWTRRADAVEKNAVVARLAALTVDDAEAVAALVWLLLPGARRIAAGLRDLHIDIEGLVAGQLWIEASRAHELGVRGVARQILRRTRREVCAELGVGDAGRRRDRVSAGSTRDLDALSDVADAEPEVEAGRVVVELLRSARDDYAISSFDYWLLWRLAEEADRQDAPAHRGRMGLTAPAVVEVVARGSELSARSLRTHAAKAIDRLRLYAEARGDAARFAEWRARHQRPVLSVREETELAIREDEFYEFVKDRRDAPLESLREEWWIAHLAGRAR